MRIFTDGPGGVRVFRSTIYRGVWVVLGRFSLLLGTGLRK